MWVFYKHFQTLLTLRYVQNKKYVNFVFISRLTGKCTTQKLKNLRNSSLWSCSHHSQSTPPKGCVWQYENNPANAFRAIVRKLNLSSAIN